VNVDPDALRRLLRALTCYGVFAEDDSGRYVHTELSRLLREDAESGLKYVVLWGTEPWTWRLWPRLDEAVRSGESVFPGMHGMGFFEYLNAQEPESIQVVNRAMAQSSKLSEQAIADTVDLNEVETVADICGGRGHVLAALLEHHPSMRGVLFDLPRVVANADARLRDGGALATRARLVSGDCRQQIPVRADAYIIKSILDWDDESTVTTLRNVAEAGGPGARVFVIENLLDGSPERGFTTAMDLLLLLNVGGRKRTTGEFAALAEKAGLQIDNVRPVDTYLHVLECSVPA
jgi:C-methyltransferase